MARICRACGRTLDEEGHDVQDVRDGIEIPDAPGGKIKFKPRSLRLYACRVRLIGDSPTSGKRITPQSPQREKALGLARYALVTNL